MAVSNIFKELKNNTGTFLMFSQYVEDLTRESTQSVYYHITPSKFVAMDINYEEYTNESIVRLLQDEFENGCAVCRKEMEDEWTPIHSTNLFWDSIFSNNLLTLNEKYINEVKYVGDINIQSYNEHDGLGYSEIYCYIPNEAKEGKYECNIGGSDVVYKSKDHLEGYNANELNGWCSIRSNISYTPHKNYTFAWDDSILNSKDVDNESFNINTIVVLYDIETKTDDGYKSIYKNVPMGIYFTGLISEGSMSNSTTKYVSSSDIYGTGTGYGLRICSRFTVTPNQDNIKTVDIEVSDDYAALSKVMAQMSISQTKMDEILTSIQSNSQAEKELLATFKNSRTNVPYIKEIDGMSYWFVNGRKIGPSVLNHEDCCIPYEEWEILDMLNKAFNLTISITAMNEEGRTVFDNSEDSAQDIYLNWNILFNNRPSTAEYLFLNDSEIEIYLPGTVMSNVSKTTTYNIRAEKDGLTASAESTIHFVWPTYFGTLPCDDSCGENAEHVFNPLESNIKTLTKYINISNSSSYTYTNETDAEGNTDHVVLAYPKEFGELNTIFDNYGYDYMNDFDVMEKTFDFKGTKVDYLVYVDKIPSEVYDFTLTFK